MHLLREYPDNVQADYGFEDLLEGVKLGLSYDGQLYSLPFYGESSMLMYNTAMFEEAGLVMPEQPTWDEVREFACALHDPGQQPLWYCVAWLARLG
jgi:sorbitol/mannitol transport system substrate-binding protein